MTTTYINMIQNDFTNPVGKTCSDCSHPAYAAFEWRVGAFAGYKCACCFRTLWESTIANLEQSIAKLPACQDD